MLILLREQCRTFTRFHVKDCILFMPTRYAASVFWNLVLVFAQDKVLELIKHDTPVAFNVHCEKELLARQQPTRVIANWVRGTEQASGWLQQICVCAGDGRVRKYSRFNSSRYVGCD